MNQDSKEEQENNHHNCSLEVNCFPLPPLQIKENFIKDVLELFESKISCCEVVLLRNRKLVVVMINVLLIAVGAIDHVCNLLSDIVLIILRIVFFFGAQITVRAVTESTLRVGVIFFSATANLRQPVN
jgi:hypothetical protein